MASKSRNRISVTDVMFIIAVLALAAVSVYKIGLFDRLLAKGSEENCTVTFAADGLSDEEAAYLAAGSQIYCGKNLLGVMRGGTTRSASVDYAASSDGKYVFSESASSLDIRGAFETTLTSTDYGWLFNGKTYITPGTVLEVRCGNAEFSITVLSVDVKAAS